MTVTRQYLMLFSACVVAACGGAPRPTPSSYRWPAELAYRVDYVSQTQKDGVAIERYAESKRTVLVLRDGRQYLGAQDSVLKTTQRAGSELRLVPYLPEDTLAFYVTIGTRGELTGVMFGCDPALPQCAEALPSSFTLELRRWIPRLPLWDPAPGRGWEDTLSFDDAARPRGTRGSVITNYTGRRDTTINGRGYWVIGWRSVRQAFRSGGNAVVTTTSPVREDGITLVDQQRQIPVFSTWAGAVVAPAELRALGADAVGFRGRAYLAGSEFDPGATAGSLRP